LQRLRDKDVSTRYGMNKKLSRAIEIAKCLKPLKQSGKNFHVTIGYAKNKIVSIGYNSYDHENLDHRFGKYKPTRNGGNNYKAGRHSETEMLRRLKIPTKGLTICNVRIDNNGDVAMAKCCDNCQKLLDSLGYRRILYSISETEFGAIY